MLKPPQTLPREPKLILSLDDTILVFDVETTGLLPPVWADRSDMNVWPHIVSASWSFYSAAGKLLHSEYLVVRPFGFTIPDEAANIHGITTEYALQVGAPLQPVLKKFAKQIHDYGPNLAVAHNMDFDLPVLSVEYQRQNLPCPIHAIPKYCTMKNTMEFCMLPGRYGQFKFPKLTELHYSIFSKDLENGHHAGADVAACASCFFALLQMKICGVPTIAAYPTKYPSLTSL